MELLYPERQLIVGQKLDDKFYKVRYLKYYCLDLYFLSIFDIVVRLLLIDLIQNSG